MLSIQTPDFLKKIYITYLSTILVYLSIIFVILSSTLDGLQNVPLFVYLLTVLPLVFGLSAALFSDKLFNTIFNHSAYINISAVLCSMVLILYYGIKAGLNSLTSNETTYITFLGVFTGCIYGFLLFLNWMGVYGGVVLQTLYSYVSTIYRNIIGLKNSFFSDSEFRTNYIQIFLSFLILFLSIFIFFYYSDNKTLSSKQSYFAIFGIVAIFIYLFVNEHVLKYIFVEHKWAVLVLGILGVLCYAGYNYFSKGTLQTIEYISIIVGCLIGIIALAILFIVFRKMLSETTGLLGLIINILFYIPCLVIDFINYIKNEIKMTSNITFVLFIIEIVLILMYVYIPIFKSQYENNSATKLLPGSIFLNQSQEFGNNDMYKLLKYGNTDTIYNSENSVYRTNYAFSFWVYINPQQKQPDTLANSSETPIFDFGQKPSFSYINNTENAVDSKGNPVNDKFVIHYTNTGAEPAYISLGKQQWHYIVFNYFNDKVDLYLDGNLERTYVFGSHLPRYSPHDLVTLGYDNGLYGAISNVKYFSINLTPENISRFYNLLMFSNPPIDT
uniref:Uncharacterized protein n=1 Tax=viral metagenome TaxID=1070528 RepID=A0A6C0DQK5_9ZZZZ